MIILKLKKLCGRGRRKHAKGKQVFIIITIQGYIIICDYDCHCQLFAHNKC